MKFRLSRRALPIAFVLASCALTAGVAKAESNDGNDMTGSWRFSLARTLPFPQQVLALATFFKEGMFVGTAQGDGICCPAEGPAHGVWTKTGHNTFAVRFEALWYQGDTSLFGILLLNMNLTLDDKAGKVTGSFQGAVVDPVTLAVKLPVAGTLTGQKIRIQP
jgi:hypothetical protein